MTAAWTDVLECVETAKGMCRISAEYVKSLKFNKDVMEEILYKGFSNATELADSLVLEGKLSFRQAHRVVGGAVSELFRGGKGQDDLTWDLLDNWCREICKTGLPLSKEQVDKAKNFRIAVERRDCQGAAAPSQVHRMLELQKEQSHLVREDAVRKRSVWNDAEKKMRQCVQAFISEERP